MDHDPEEEKTFMEWLQCYYQDGMKNLVDANGRTVWFAGDPGKLAPKGGKSRGKVGQKKEKVKAEVQTEVKTPKVKREMKTEVKPEVKSVGKRGKAVKREVVVKTEANGDSSPTKKTRRRSLRTRT